MNFQIGGFLSYHGSEALLKVVGVNLPTLTVEILIDSKGGTRLLSRRARYTITKFTHAYHVTEEEALRRLLAG